MILFDKKDKINLEKASHCDINFAYRLVLINKAKKSEKRWKKVCEAIMAKRIYVGLAFLTVISLYLVVGDFAFARTIEVIQSPTPTTDVLVTAPWTYKEKIEAAKIMLQGVELELGIKEIAYYEKRYSLTNKGKIVENAKKRSDLERQIGLVVLNKETGDLKTVIIRQIGGELVSPDDFKITKNPRPNGIEWNVWNTPYKAPAPWVVILNKWPDWKTTTLKVPVRDKKGKVAYKKETKREIKYVVYSPFSPDLHVPELVDAGKKYIQDSIDEAERLLRERKVMSRAFPSKLVADVMNQYCKECIRHLPILEHTDYTEVASDPKLYGERVLVLLGANGNRTFSNTLSSAGAKGVFQYTRGTWNMMRTRYKAAKLSSDFELGTADTTMSAMAAMLLHDNNLGGLISNFGDGIVNDPRLEEYLAASYNGSPSHVYKSLRSTPPILAQISAGSETAELKFKEWTKYLKDETKGYIAKARELYRIKIWD